MRAPPPHHRPGPPAGEVAGGAQARGLSQAAGDERGLVRDDHAAGPSSGQRGQGVRVVPAGVVRVLLDEYQRAGGGHPVATCPITQGALIRMLVRRGVRPDQALSQLAIIAAQPRHEFWPDQVPFTDVALTGVIGHRQVTDSYLAQLARSRAGWLATLDQGLAQLHSDVAHLVSA